MKKVIISLGTAFIFSLSVPAMAQENKPETQQAQGMTGQMTMDHTGQMTMDQTGQMTMDHTGKMSMYPPGKDAHEKETHETDHSSHKGMLIHESKVDGYKFAYHLIDMGGHAMPGMKATHHLMVYVVDARGHNVEKAKVGYVIEGPKGAKQKLMCMGMEGGFGSDVNLKAKGKYTIKVKVAGEKKLTDEFTYKVK